MANQNFQDFNVCKNWGLRCYEMKITEKSVILKCSTNRKDKTTGEYTAPIYIDVICPFETCDIAEDDYAKNFINVDGKFSAGGYTNREGVKIATMTIFADKVTKSVK